MTVHGSLIPRKLIPLFVAFPAIGWGQVCLYAVTQAPARLHRRVALRAVLAGTGGPLLFRVGGEILLKAPGVRLGSVQMVGGVVLALVTLRMIFGKPNPMNATEQANRDHPHGAMVPLEMPSIASLWLWVVRAIVILVIVFLVIVFLVIVLLADDTSHSIPDPAMTASLLLVGLAMAPVLDRQTDRRAAGQTALGHVPPPRLKDP